jgi:endonuclease/exonuclease/phosphatase family metal-dependent hydrolase
MPIRILSYNIHKGIGGRDRRYRLDRILSVLDHERPDIVCLQEVDRQVRRSRYEQQAQLIAQHLGFEHSCFQLTLRVGRRDGGGYGNLLASRWPFREHHHVSLTLRQRKPRGAQWAVVESPLGDIRVVNWHLGLVGHERAWQVRRLLEHHLFRSTDVLPTIVIGDTNDWRNQLAAGPFMVHGYQQITAPPSRFRSFPAYLPLGSLDKAFLRGSFRSWHARVSRFRLARDASDHLPLVVDLE